MKTNNNEQGFYFKGQFITDPTIDPTGRFPVDPKKYYGLTDEQLEQLKEEAEDI